VPNDAHMSDPKRQQWSDTIDFSVGKDDEEEEIL
jgi:hypothetical protein